MGFLKISAQESVKSIISNQSIESSATYTCTCGGCSAKSTENMTRRNDSLHNQNEKNLCVHGRNIFHSNRRKIVQQIFLCLLGLCIFLFLWDLLRNDWCKEEIDRILNIDSNFSCVGSIAFIPCGASIAWSSNFLFGHWNDSQVSSFIFIMMEHIWIRKSWVKEIRNK